LIREYQYQGSEPTVQEADFTDVHGIYLLNRIESSYEQGAFAGDHENEVTALWRKKKHRVRYIRPDEVDKFGFKRRY